MELTPEQVALIEQANPYYRERHVESACPGELLCPDTHFAGVFKGVGKVYLHKHGHDLLYLRAELSRLTRQTPLRRALTAGQEIRVIPKAWAV